MESKDYFIFSNRRWDSLKESSFRKHNLRDQLWSARISTRLFGHTTCQSGNQGPKNKREVLLAEGDEGLIKLVDLGFIPCPTCKPQLTEGSFFDVIENKVKNKYGFKSVYDFCDKQKLPFDARRLEWEEITNIVEGLPSRIYVPVNLQPVEVQKFANRLKCIQGSSLSTSIPPIGFYDANSPTRFTEYKLKE